MSTLFERLKTDLPQGWCSESKAESLASSIVALRPRVSVEIGVWFGKSLAAMALAHKEIKFGKVIGIDAWSAEASAEGMDNEADREWWGKKVDHEVVFQSCLKSLTDLDIAEYHQIHRCKSDDYNPQSVIGILHLDGNHSLQALKDVNRYAPFVSNGGLVFLDDLGWSGGGTNRAAQYLKENGFEELYVVNDKENVWACYRRVK